MQKNSRKTTDFFGDARVSRFAHSSVSIVILLSDFRSESCEKRDFNGLVPVLPWFRSGRPGAKQPVHANVERPDAGGLRHLDELRVGLFRAREHDPRVLRDVRRQRHHRRTRLRSPYAPDQPRQSRRRRHPLLLCLTLDDADQRTQVLREDGKTYTYAYDPIGNRQHAILNNSTNTYNANKLNQYTSVESVTSVVAPVFDDGGNMAEYGE